jgi:hypothetical protein
MRPNEQQVHNLKSTLVHRYDDIRDILAVKRFKCSEVYSSSVKVFKFDRVAVVPTKTVPYDLVAYGDAMGTRSAGNTSRNPLKIGRDDPALTTLESILKMFASLL